MKRIKKQKTFSKEYYPVIVWIEDLRDLCDVLKSKGGQLEISTDDYKFESLEDAAEHFGVTPQFELKLSTDKPYAQVEFSRYSTRVYVAPSDDSTRVFFELNELLAGRQRKLPFLYSYWLLIPLNIPPFLAAVLPAAYSLWVQFAWGVFFCWYVWAIFVKVRRSSVVRFQRRSESNSFLTRNRDQLLLIIVSAVVGGFITFAGAKLKEKFFPPDAIVQPKS